MRKIILILLTWLASTLPAYAQIAFVNFDKGSSTTGNGSTIATAGISHTAGNTLIVLTGQGNEITNTVSSISNTAGDTFTQGTSCRTATGNFSVWLDIWYVASTNGNSNDVVTVTFSANDHTRFVYVAQYSGVAASPFEVCAHASVTSATSATTSSFSPVASGNVNVGIAINSTNTTYTSGTNYTLRDSQTSPAIALEDRTGAPSGSQTASINTGASTDILLLVGSFKAATVPTSPIQIR